jgi:sugar lactone lactonase YvrE
MAELNTLVNGLVVGESPRWHDGRLWFAHWGAQEIAAVDGDGKVEMITAGPKSVGFSVDWLSDGTMLVTGEGLLLRQDTRGELVIHADLSALGDSWNEIVVDGRDNVYVNCVGFRFGQEEFRPGFIALVTPDGEVRRVAEDIAFPNGMVITPDNRTLIIAESWANRLTAFDIAADGGLGNRRVWAPVGGDGICLDAEGAVWCAGMTGSGTVCVRVREGGEVLQRIDLDTACFACMLGGERGTTLFLMVAEWRGVDRMGELFQSHTGRIVTFPVDVPHAGRP